MGAKTLIFQKDEEIAEGVRKLHCCYGKYKKCLPWSVFCNRVAMWIRSWVALEKIVPSNK